MFSTRQVGGMGQAMGVSDQARWLILVSECAEGRVYCQFNGFNQRCMQHIEGTLESWADSGKL